MKEFFVGLVVLLMSAVLLFVGVMLVPLLLLMGIFFRLILGLVFVLLVIWLVGKVTLVSIEYLRRREEKHGG